MVRKLTAGMICLGLSCGLNGCFLHKKTQAVVLPQSKAPVALAPAPGSVSDVMVEPKSVGEPPVPTVAAIKLKKRRQSKAVPATPPVAPPTQVASAADVEGGGSAIGALTAGGDSNAQTHQEAVDLIASNEKKLSELSADALRDKKTQINKIRNFQRQAQEALKSGDADGAMTLATKAKLLLFDLDRSGGE